VECQALGAQEIAGICMADAFATWSMGPAYACAAILMRLDPLAADEGLTQKRAAVVLSALRHLDRMTGPTERNLSGFVTILEEQWRLAIEQTGTERALSADDRQVEQWVSIVIEAMGPYAGLPATYWSRIDEFYAKLGEKEPTIKAKLEDELRHLVNAAWKRRLDHPDQARQIAEAAQHLWLDVQKQRRAPPSDSQLKLAGWVPVTPGLTSGAAPKASVGG
jgi:hypothetical protein